ncbi:hypothetical protein AJ79_08983 [Helicocarpus griseus UAMH5409]|uniref:Cytochrome P450 monooxygenase n=1 Tax=Helicocarpus griseus UAMH5409 TaxID=1447875 RepID=A0A2B7WNA1_9EURO|nr:hypothetical protein AJ79_08983 [Helicocarpus griseus UAMH5409]
MGYAYDGGYNSLQQFFNTFNTWRTTRIIDRYIANKLVRRYDELKNEDSYVVKKSKSIMDLVLRQKLDNPRVIAGDREFMEMAVSNVKSFLVAGHETTAYLGYAYMLLSKNPQALEKARQEHDQVFDPDLNRTVEILRANPGRLYDLHYTTGIIKEALRLFPAASSTRTCAKGYRFMYKGRDLQLTDQIVIICSLAMHYNPNLFPSPCEFQPERYTTQAVPKDAWRPFERGSRSCIGQNLAMMEMRMVLLLVLRSFDFEALGIKPHNNPIATYTNLDTIYGDLIYQRQALTARPIGGQSMKVKFAEREY